MQLGANHNPLVKPLKLNIPPKEKLSFTPKIPCFAATTKRNPEQNSFLRLNPAGSYSKPNLPTCAKLTASFGETGFYFDECTEFVGELVFVPEFAGTGVAKMRPVRTVE